MYTDGVMKGEVQIIGKADVEVEDYDFGGVKKADSLPLIRLDLNSNVEHTFTSPSLCSPIRHDELGYYMLVVGMVPSGMRRRR